MNRSGFSQVVSVLTGKDKEKKCSHGYGILTVNKDGRRINDVIIKKNATLPAQGVRNLKAWDDKRSDLTLVLIEGNTTELDRCRKLCVMEIPYPLGIKRKSDIQAKFIYDTENQLHITLEMAEKGGMEFEVMVNLCSEAISVSMGQWKEKENNLGETYKYRQNERSVNSDRVKDRSKKAAKIPKLVTNCMDGIVGMKEVAEKLRDYINLKKNNESKGLGGRVNANFLIYGPDSTGKRTAAELIVKVLYENADIESAEPVRVRREDFASSSFADLPGAVEAIIQQSADSKQAIILDNIEEYYEEASPSAGIAILDAFVKKYKAANEKPVVIAYGKDTDTKKLLAKLRTFEDMFGVNLIEKTEYSVDEYVRIAHIVANSREYVIEEAADSNLEQLIKSAMSRSDFEHLRTLRRIVEQAEVNAANKVANKRRVTTIDAMILRAEDFVVDSSEETLEELLEQLNSMVGLKNVKEEVSELVANMKVLNNEKKNGHDCAHGGIGTLHLVFEGNPGTGKTEVARLISKIYKALGILPSGHFVEATKSDLVSQFVGETPQKVKEVVDKALGGVLFIDEAYTLTEDESDKFGKEAVDQLVAYLENERDRFAVILAGYPAEVDRLIATNPGLDSRMKRRLHFQDYTNEELLEIFKRFMSKDNMLFAGEAEVAVFRLIKKESSGKDYGNARGVRNLYEAIRRRQRKRLAYDGTDLRDYNLIFPEDVEDLTAGEKKGGAEAIIAELDSMIGLENVKQQVKEFCALAEVNQYRQELGQEFKNSSSLHMAFRGNPGTGKTTIARMFGKYYASIGLLSKGHVVECDRSTLVGSYVGQTEANTKKRIAEARGGVLFIDEAYSLAAKGENDFGQRAIETLLSQMENYRNDLCVIIAGYTDEIEEFLNTNPGLGSRFKNRITFDDYSAEEMVLIFKRFAEDNGFILEEGIEDVLVNHFRCKMGDSAFGNGRGVRNLYENAVLHQSFRISMQPDWRGLPEDEIRTIKGVDIA